MKKFLFLFIVFSLFLSGCALDKDKEAKSIISPEEAKAKAEDFINSYLVNPDNKATVKSVEDSENYSDYYRISVDTPSMQDIESFISKDGKRFVLSEESVDMEEFVLEVEQASQQPSQSAVSAASYSEEDLNKISEFITCLKKEDFMVYGANWCGYTQQLVETLGGYDVSAPVYVECTVDQQICASKVEQGYPTIRIKDKVYEGPRLLESFGEATGCAVPSLSVVNVSNSEASC